jgi:toxin ParE1/3/4
MTPTFSPAAATDIGAIWNYTAETWGPDQADRYIDTIRDTCLALAKGEITGRRVEVRDGYLKYPVGRHLVFFRQTKADTQIIRVLHEMMDTERHL